jgi:16S rRNA processing protein RimM
MVVVGWIARPHGIRGQVILNPETDFPDERFQQGSELFVLRGGAVESLRLTAVRFQRDRPVVGIAGVDSVDRAKELQGAELRVPAERLVRLPEGTFYRHDLVGWRVETTAGTAVGVVEGVEGTHGAMRLVVTSGRDEILIPFASEICREIDRTGRRIVVEPPDGLLELNRRQAKVGADEVRHRDDLPGDVRPTSG